MTVAASFLGLACVVALVLRFSRRLALPAVLCLAAALVALGAETATGSAVTSLTSAGIVVTGALLVGTVMDIRHVLRAERRRARAPSERLAA